MTIAPLAAKTATTCGATRMWSATVNSNLSLHKHYLHAGIGIVYQRLSWDDFEGSDSLRTMAEAYLKKASGYVNNGVSIILYGDLGVGKTMALTLLLKDLVKAGYDCYSTTFTSMIDMFTAGWKSREDQKLYQRRVTQSQILLLDDLGKEMKTSTKLSESTFDSLLRTRVQNARPIFLTTNMTLEDMKAGYGNAVFSLMQENAIMLSVAGDDFRPKARQRSLAELSRGETRPIV